MTWFDIITVLHRTLITLLPSLTALLVSYLAYRSAMEGIDRKAQIEIDQKRFGLRNALAGEMTSIVSALFVELSTELATTQLEKLRQGNRYSLHLNVGKDFTKIYDACASDIGILGADAFPIVTFYTLFQTLIVSSQTIQSLIEASVFPYLVETKQSIEEIALTIPGRLELMETAAHEVAKAYGFDSMKNHLETLFKTRDDLHNAKPDPAKPIPPV